VVVLLGGFVLQTAIARQLGTAELGLYYVSAKIAYLITEVSEELVGGVAFPWFSRLQSDRAAARRMFVGVLRGLAIVLIPASFMLAALAPSIVEDMLGPRWIGAAPVIQVMLVSTLLGGFGDAIPPLLRGLGQPHKPALLDLVTSILLASLVWSLAGAFGVVGAAAAWIPALGVAQILGFAMVRGVFRAPLEGVWKIMASMALVAAPGALLALWIDATLGGLGGLVLAAAAGSVVILVMFVAADRSFSLGLVEDVATFSPRVGDLLRQGAARLPGRRQGR
jgi:O-antigen/teichoic acid export membrane protein